MPDAREEAERRWPDTPHGPTAERRATWRDAFVDGAEWQAAQQSETRITDEIVAKGGKALYVIHDTDDWGKTAPEIATMCEEVARAVLVAALEGA